MKIIKKSIYEAGDYGETCGHSHSSLIDAESCLKQNKFKWVEKKITQTISVQLNTLKFWRKLLDGGNP